MRSLYPHTLVRSALASATRTNGTVNGTAVDLSVFNNDFRSIMFVVLTATVTDGSHAVTVEESENGSTGWTVVPAARRQGSFPTVTATDDDAFFTFGVLPSEKVFYRIVAVTSGAITGGVFSAIALLSNGSDNPVNRA